MDRMVKVCIESYGCWINKALSEYVRQLVAEEATVVERVEDANVVVLITCAVRGDTERRMLARLKELHGAGKRIVVTGCLVNVRPYSISEAAPGASLVDPSCIDAVARAVKGEDVWLVREYRRSLYAYEYSGGVRYVLPIELGCQGSCGFCVERVVRKGVVSLSPESVLKLVADAVKRGAREIYLTGQDVASYGLDLGVRLPQLLELILSEVDGEYRIRIGMMEPWTAAGIAKDLAEAMKDERVYKYLHLPLQSGDDGVLRLMGRRYTVAEYKALATFFRSALGQLSLVTDIIVGYPGEGWEAFLNSVSAVREMRFDKVHVARYTFRPFTPAYLANDTVPEPEKKRRSRILSEVALKVAGEINASYVGKVLTALVCERGAKEGTVVARSDTYKPIILPDVARMGEWVKVKITDSTPIYLVGEILD